MSKRCGVPVTVVSTILFLSVLISLIPLNQIAFAGEKTHYAAARELVDITYNEQITYEASRKVGLQEVADRFENNPKTKNYSSVMVGLAAEVMDAYFHDPETQNKIRMGFEKIYTEEFTESEIRELVKFYRTSLGQKTLQRLPVVMQKEWEMGSEIGSQVFATPKYKQMLAEKFKALQDKGTLPKEFK
jgi:hypothetical protein